MPVEPKLNPELYGHETAEKLFLDHVSSERLPHAWLISGVKGIGKATLAYRMARYILADVPPPEDGLFGPAETTLQLPETHSIFGKLEQGSHSDLLTITAESEDGSVREITVDEIRSLHSFFGMSSGETGWRIIVIDGAEHMNRNAQNALLKILEEPPEKALLFLVCHNKGRMLTTIHSRCRQLALHPLSDEDVARALDAELDDQIAEIASGSPGLALQLMETDCAQAIERLEELVDSPDDALALAEQLTKRGTESAWPTHLILLRHILLKRMKESQNNTIFSLWDRLNRMESETIGLNMDKKMALMRLVA